MDKSSNKINIIFQWLGIIFIIFVWLICSNITNNIQVFPTVSSTFLALINLLKNESTYTAFGLTFLRTILAIAFSLILGIFFGVISGLNQKFQNFMSPIVKLMKFIPVPCFIVLMYSSFLSNPNLSSIILSFIVIFPIIYDSVVSGISNIDSNIIKSLKLEGLYKFNSVFKVIFPMSFPYLVLGIINSIGLGVKISVMSEIIIGSNKIRGIGRLIYSAQLDANSSQLFAIIFLVLIIFIVIDLVSLPFINKTHKMKTNI